MTDRHERTTSSQGRSWTLTVGTLILAIDFTIETGHDLPASTPARWLHLAAALFTAYLFVHHPRTAVRTSQQHDRSR